MTKSHDYHGLEIRLGFKLFIFISSTVTLNACLKFKIIKFQPLTKDANYHMRKAFVKMLGHVDEMVIGVALDISDETRERKLLRFNSPVDYF